MANIQVYPNIVALVQNVADYIASVARSSIADHGCFNLGLSGGHTPRPALEFLASTTTINWSRVYVFWGDERCVPPDHPASNYRLARELLLDLVPIPTEQIFRIRGELDPAEAAADYQAILHAHFGNIQPRFDLMFQGIGDDGHTASLYPETLALHDRQHWVVANYVEKLSAWRVTLTPQAINAASHIMFMVSGQHKAQAVREVLQGDFHPDQYPAQLIQPDDGELVWMLDAAAAALL